MQKTGILATAAQAALIACGLGALSSPADAADADKSYVMKMGLATINDAQHQFCKLFVAAVEKDSGGRIKGEIYPASQLGSIPRQIEGVQFGSIQAYIGPPEFLVGVDERYEIPSTPGMIDSIEQGARVTADPEVKRMMFALGANKGIHGVAMFISQPSSVIAKSAIRQLADFKGKKLRVLAADMQQEMLKRLGATPVAMTLADVLPGIQQGAIDGAVAVVTVYTTMQYVDAAKYVTETGQPFIFSMGFISKKWYDALPADLQKIIDADADKAAGEANTWELDFYAQQRKAWVAHGGELIALPPDQQAAMMDKLASIGEDLTKAKPDAHETYKIFAAAAKRDK
ncbi:MAG TPA: TRAP transporter substrate-binding protein [Stellaceae bacterium]|nr:TRAP transporter substrate-binding protein [Stellaceae bacterium]